jgi:DNA-binding response OmpR family regulator
VIATDAGEAEEVEITEVEAAPIELDPLAPEEDDEPILVEDEPAAGEEVVLSVRPSGRRTILVVDDEPEIRLLVQRALEKHGYAIETAADGAEGIAKAEALVPDLVLLDAMLPKVHGFDACRQLKSGGRTRRVPIIMMTAVYRGWRFAEDARDSYGAEDYVEKPFRFEDLLRRIESVLEATGSRPRPDVTAAVAHVARGKAHLVASRLADARVEFEAAIAADPYSAEAHAQLARTLRAAGDGFSAMTAFEKAAELRPNHLGVLRALAALYEEKGFRRKATEALERALSAAPDDATRVTVKQDLLKLLG